MHAHFFPENRVVAMRVQRRFSAQFAQRHATVRTGGGAAQHSFPLAQGAPWPSGPLSLGQHVRLQGTNFISKKGTGSLVLILSFNSDIQK
jgi:hypothetical protein